MKLKKTVALLCTAGLLTGMLSGCGSSNSGTQSPDGSGNAGNSADDGNGDGGVEQVNLKVWVPEEEMEMTQEMCKAFNEAHPEFDCTFDIAVVGVDESADNLETDPELAADVFQVLFPS